MRAIGREGVQRGLENGFDQQAFRVIRAGADSISLTAAEHLRTETLALGQEETPLLAKDPDQARWEQRHKDFDEACAPYDF